MLADYGGISMIQGRHCIIYTLGTNFFIISHVNICGQALLTTVNITNKRNTAPIQEIIISCQQNGCTVHLVLQCTCTIFQISKCHHKYLPIPMVDLMYICVYPLDWAHTSFKVPTELIATDLICK